MDDLLEGWSRFTGPYILILNFTLDGFRTIQ